MEKPVPIRNLTKIDMPDMVIKDLPKENRGTLEHYEAKNGTKRSVQSDAKNCEEKKRKLAKQD